MLGPEPLDGCVGGEPIPDEEALQEDALRSAAAGFAEGRHLPQMWMR